MTAGAGATACFLGGEVKSCVVTWKRSQLTIDSMLFVLSCKSCIWYLQVSTVQVYRPIGINK